MVCGASRSERFRGFWESVKRAALSLIITKLETFYRPRAPAMRRTASLWAEALSPGLESAFRTRTCFGRRVREDAGWHWSRCGGSGPRRPRLASGRVCRGSRIRVRGPAAAEHGRSATAAAASVLALPVSHSTGPAVEFTESRTSRRSTFPVPGNSESPPIRTPASVSETEFGSEFTVKLSQRMTVTDLTVILSDSELRAVWHVPVPTTSFFGGCKYACARHSSQHVPKCSAAQVWNRHACTVS